GDGVVVAFAVPLRNELASLGIDSACVAAADVDPEGHTGKAFDHCVVSIDGSLQVPLRALPTRAHSIQGYFIDVSRIARSIDLNVFAAGFYQLRDHLPLDRDDVFDKIVEPLVHVRGSFPLEALRHAI